MKFGLFSNDRRPSRIIGEAWRLDIDEVVVADQAGFQEAWFSEHQAPAELIITQAAALTKTIKLGSAVRPLPYYHPVQFAIEANAVDQLTGGRYMLGVGPGFLPDRVAWRGIDPKEMRTRTAASIELILRMLKNPSTGFDHDGPFWKGKGMMVDIAPVQLPHPPIALAVAHSPESAIFAGEHGLYVLTSDFVSNKQLRVIGDAFVEGQRAKGGVGSRRDLRVCRVVYVAETEKQARDDMRDSYNDTIKWEIANTPWHQEDRIPPGGTFADITFDYLVDTGNLLLGTPAQVVKLVERLYDEVGGFGTLLFHAGRDYATPEKLARSMRLFAKDVAPELQHLDGSVAVKAAAE